MPSRLARNVTDLSSRSGFLCAGAVMVANLGPDSVCPEAVTKPGGGGAVTVLELEEALLIAIKIEFACVWDKSVESLTIGSHHRARGKADLAPELEV